MIESKLPLDTSRTKDFQIKNVEKLSSLIISNDYRYDLDLSIIFIIKLKSPTLVCHPQIA